MSRWGIQDYVRKWALECLGYEVLYDERERRQRVLEEAVEVFQSMGGGRKEAHAIVDWKMDGQVGDLQQEVGGLVICTAALCASRAIDMEDCTDTELARCFDRIPEIREKQRRKPTFVWAGK